MGPIRELIQTLKECSFCHNYCAHLCMHVHAIIIVFCAVSNGEPLYLVESEELEKWNI